MMRKGSSVEAFLATSRSAKAAEIPPSSEAPQSRSAPFGPAREAAPVRDTAGEALDLLAEAPLPPAEVSRRLGLSTTEAIALLERLEHFGFVTITTEGAQRLVKLTGT